MSLSIFFLVYTSAPPVMHIPRMSPPDAAASSKTLNPEFSTLSFMLFSSNPNLVSGLSLPYLSIASLYVRRGKGVFISMPMMSENRRFKNPSCMLMTSSTSTKDISRSIWVNSGCLSALRSSSLKHLTICMYLSVPPTIRSCLNICGDWGSA